MSAENLFDKEENDGENKGKNLTAWHLGFYIIDTVKQFFSSPYKKEKRELNVLDSIQTLLESEPTDENINKCQELSKLHRMVENTKARRRLEKWSLRVIAWYLIIVLVVVFLSYTKICWLNILDIEPQIMIAVLTTTTVNIIGLGLIVLRGHFLANDASNSMEDEDKKKKDK